MHELSLVEYSLNAVERRAAEMNIKRVAEVGLVVGKLSVVPAAMEKAFAILKTQRPMFEDASLHLEVRNIRLRCRDCGCEFSSSDVFSFSVCPECGSPSHELLAGNELYIDYFKPAQD